MAKVSSPKAGAPPGRSGARSVRCERCRAVLCTIDENGSITIERGMKSRMKGPQLVAEIECPKPWCRFVTVLSSPASAPADSEN